MENPGVMSLWIGNFKTKNNLKEYIEIKFDEVGDRIQSEFMNDFGMDFTSYNQDLLEISFRAVSTASLTTLLSGSSYESVILLQFVEHYGEVFSETYDSVIKLYDFEYEGNIEKVKFKDGNLTYLGSVYYEE
ncbi:immunity 22 family protein [Niallia sp. BSM11]|uniref:immunity 22 family protein n=1 Tax=Niallia sp. BSM11 TaxID=3391576 RepID=UPI003984E764